MSERISIDFTHTHTHTHTYKHNQTQVNSKIIDGTAVHQFCEREASEFVQLQREVLRRKKRCTNLREFRTRPEFQDNTPCCKCVGYGKIHEKSPIVGIFTKLDDLKSQRNMTNEKYCEGLIQWFGRKKRTVQEGQERGVREDKNGIPRRVARWKRIVLCPFPRVMWSIT